MVGEFDGLWIVLVLDSLVGEGKVVISGVEFFGREVGEKRKKKKEERKKKKE